MEWDGLANRYFQIPHECQGRKRAYLEKHRACSVRRRARFAANDATRSRGVIVSIRTLAIKTPSVDSVDSADIETRAFSLADVGRRARIDRLFRFPPIDL